MSNNDGFANDKAREMHDVIWQCEQLRSIAKCGVGFLGDHVTKAIVEAAETIERLAFKPTSSAPGASNKKADAVLIETTATLPENRNGKSSVFNSITHPHKD